MAMIMTNPNFRGIHSGPRELASYVQPTHGEVYKLAPVLDEMYFESVLNPFFEKKNICIL
jgi:hypothetical protein